MNKVVLGLMLTFMSTNAMAEWTQVAENDFNVAYIDLATIKKRGSKLEMWALIDNKSLKDIFGYKYLSQKIHYGIDCKEKQIRVIEESYYEGYMGDGHLVIYIGKAGDWDSIETGTEGEGLLEMACFKN